MTGANRVPDHHWQIISVDLIMVVVDRLSKQAHVIPMTLDIMASGVAWLFRDHIWKLQAYQKK